MPSEINGATASEKIKMAFEAQADRYYRMSVLEKKVLSHEDVQTATAINKELREIEKFEQTQLQDGKIKQMSKEEIKKMLEEEMNK